MTDEHTQTEKETPHPKRERNRSHRSEPRRGRGRRREERESREFEQKILDLARVTRVTAGGKRMSFRCALVIGDKKGRVGLGVAKGKDVQMAIEKAYRQAKKRLIRVSIMNETVAHPVWVKFGAALLLVKPAPKGTGLKSGGAARMVLEFAGVPNVVSKIVNSANKINIAKATLKALKQLRAIEDSSASVAGVSPVQEQPPKELDVAVKEAVVDQT